MFYLKRYFFYPVSMSGKQVCDIPPTNVGGSPFCIAVSSRGMDIQKVGDVTQWHSIIVLCRHC